MKHKNHVELLGHVFSKSNHILAMYSLKSVFVKHYPLLQDKIIYVEHPLLIKFKEADKKREKSNNSVNLTYTGSFLKGYVNPNYFFELFSDEKFNKFEINLFVRGDCSVLVNDFATNNSNNVVNHGSVSFEKAVNAIYNSDFLINVAEVSGKQMSSKIFTFMSAGKPIIHFYSSEDDINKLILEKYPLSICIKQDLSRLEENILRVEDFIISNMEKSITFEKVSDIYREALPCFTANIIERLSYEA